MATLSENVPQAISDFADIKTAIEAKGVAVPSGTPTSDYDSLIEDIPTGDDSVLISLIERTATSLSIPQGTTAIGDFAFWHYYQLLSILIPSGVTSIGQAAFHQCSSLTSLTIPNGVTSIGQTAFYLCNNLANLTIPSSITSIGMFAFDACYSLENITIGNGFNCDGLDLSASNRYSVDTIVGWFNALVDRTGQAAYTLTIGATNLAKLTAEQIAIATNKNWNLA